MSPKVIKSKKTKRKNRKKHALLTLPKGEGKMLNVLDKFIHDDSFQNQVFLFRTKFNIPLEGYEISSKKLAGLRQSSFLCSVHLPPEMENKGKTLRTINLAIREIAKKAPLQASSVQHNLKLYLLYNKLPVKNTFNSEIQNLCKISDLVADVGDYGITDIEDREEYLMSIYIDGVVRSNELYPIAIKIHPAATRGVVIDFIRKNWELIDDLQAQYLKEEKYNLKSAKATMPKNRDRDRFVFKHRAKPYKKIQALAREAGYDVDTGEIGKIISIGNALK